MNDSFDPYLEWLGIPLHERPHNYYQLLGLQTFENDPAVIAAHADERMGRLRTFQVGPRGAWSQRLLNELAAARGCLTNPETKAAYDVALRGFMAVESVRAPVVNAGPPQYAVPPPPPPPTTVAATPQAPAGGQSTMTAPTVDVLSPPPITPTYVSIREVSQPTSPREPATAPRNPWMFAVAGIVIAVLAAIGWLLLARGGSKVPSAGDATRVEPSNQKPPEETSSKGRDGKARVEDSVVVEPDKSGKLDFSSPRAELEGKGLELQIQDAKAVVSGWRDRNASLRWRFRVPKPGIYQVLVHYSASEAMAGGIMQLVIDDDEKQTKQCDVRESGEGKFHFEKLFIKVARAGDHALRLGVVKMPADEFLIFDHIEFLPQR